MDKDKEEESKENVCLDQKTYNNAFIKAFRNYNNTEDECKTDICRTHMTIFKVILILFYIWAALLACKVEDKNERIIHLIFAFLTGPVYVLAHYCSFYT